MARFSSIGRLGLQNPRDDCEVEQMLRGGIYLKLEVGQRRLISPTYRGFAGKSDCSQEGGSDRKDKKRAIWLLKFTIRIAKMTHLPGTWQDVEVEGGVGGVQLGQHSGNYTEFMAE